MMNFTLAILLFSAFISYQLWLIKRNEQIRQDTKKLISQLSPDKLSVMTYNLRSSNLDSGKFSWQNRIMKTVDNIYQVKPVFIGTQEGLHSQILELASHLPDYSFSSLIPATSHTETEHLAIFYDKSIVEVLSQGHFWISDEPEIAFSTFYDANFPRMVTYIECSVNLGNDIQHLIIVNTHLDHVSRKARLHSPNVITETLAVKLGEKYLEIPIILLGDFNEANGQPTHQAFLKKGFKDLFMECALIEGCDQSDNFSSTFTMYFGKKVENAISRFALYFAFFYHAASPPEYGRYHIDWVLYRGNSVIIEPIVGFVMVDENDEDQGSDHYPVVGIFKVLQGDGRHFIN